MNTHSVSFLFLGLLDRLAVTWGSPLLPLLGLHVTWFQLTLLLCFNDSFLITSFLLLLKIILTEVKGSWKRVFLWLLWHIGLESFH